MRRTIPFLSVVVLACVPAYGDETTLQGEWRTSLGVVTFKPDGNALIATFANSQFPTAKGTLTGKTATLQYAQARKPGEAKLTLDEHGRSFSGSYQLANGRQIPWQGYRPDPEATKGETGRFGGLWLTTSGLMELEQTGDKVKGQYARYGPVKLEGTITGRRLEFRYTWLRNGKGWLDLSQDGKSFNGAAVADGTNSWYRWHGRQAPEFRRHAPLAAGQIVNGSTRNLLTYSVRAPEGYKDGEPKRWPAIVILHGSNMNGEAYVASIARAWPDIARDYLLIGINGEVPAVGDPPAEIGKDPRFNYTYVNFMGRSTYGGYPGTDRESPALVAEALDDLRKTYPVGRYFVGGHSQGGWLTYSILMNFPERIAGAFPISCGLMFQCEPGAYKDDGLRAAQRLVPLAIVHARNDNTEDFSLGQYAASTFGEHGWPGLRLFASDTASHMFMLLPVGEAIRWLESLSSDDPEVLLGFADKQAAASHYRDAIAAIRRAKALKLTDSQKQRADTLSKSIDARAKTGADEFLPRIRKNADGSWIDGFLAYRDEFEFADAAREVMGAFEALRKQQEPLADKSYGEAMTAFRQGKRDEGYAKYQEIVDKDYASSRYRNIKEQLSSRQ